MSVTESMVSQRTIALPTAGDPAARRARVPLLGVLLAFAGMLSLAAAGAGTLAGDVAISRWAQGVTLPGLGELTRFVNWTGNGTQLSIIVVLSALGLAAVRRFEAASLVAAGLLVQVVNPILKAVADSPRPTPNLVRVTEIATGNGFPSGHTMGVTLFYGTIIVLAPALTRSVVGRRVVQGLAGGMIVATGFSRVYSGAHWPSDVLGGFLWGSLCLLLLLRVYRHRAVTAGAVPFRSWSTLGWRRYADRNRAADPA